MYHTSVIPGPANVLPAPLLSPAPAPSAKPLVLVVDDDPRMRKYVHSVLSDHGFRVVDAASGAEAVLQAAAHNPDLIVLDFALPDMDGTSVTTKLREWTVVPILLVSAHGAEHNKVAALDAGANDFLMKPFGTGEFMARIRVWLRHVQRGEAGSFESVLDIGRLRIDFARRLAFVDGREAHLTPTQYRLFSMLMRNAGRVLTHEQLLLAVWGPAYTKETQYLRVYMAQLRHKFEEDPARPRYFITESGVGYRLRIE
jgi:two-component system KDP operon response regulator KdpE